MEIKIRDWGATVGGIVLSAIIVYLAIDDGQMISVFILDLRRYDTDLVTFIEVIFGLIIGLYYAMNSFTIVNEEKDLLSLPTFYGFMRSNIKLSEIESWDRKIKRTAHDPETSNVDSKTYILIVYGRFGKKTALYTSYKIRQEVIDNLESALS